MIEIQNNCHEIIKLHSFTGGTNFIIIKNKYKYNPSVLIRNIWETFNTLDVLFSMSQEEVLFKMIHKFDRYHDLFIDMISSEMCLPNNRLVDIDVYDRKESIERTIHKYSYYDIIVYPYKDKLLVSKATY